MSERDPFEQRLSGQPMREIPGPWRAEILAAAQAAAAPRHTTRNPQPVSWWRELFWPHPAAWAALAGAWLVMLGGRIVLREEAPVQFARQAAPSRQLRELLREQGQLLAELVGPREAPPVDRLRLSVPRPHGARREETVNV